MEGQQWREWKRGCLQSEIASYRKWLADYHRTLHEADVPHRAGLDWAAGEAVLRIRNAEAYLAVLEEA